jgi:type IV pilus assembly protein PilC
MATATTTAPRKADVKEYTFLWEGVDRNNRQVRGEAKAASETVVRTNLRRQGVRIVKIKRQTFRGGRAVNDRDITYFTRQLATMLRAGVPLLQAFEIVARGHSNARFSRLMMDIKSRVESGSSLSQAFREHPKQFDILFCNLVAAGETAGMLDGILDRLATYKEKILAIKSKIKSALFYPVSIIVVAFVITAVIMIFVIPAFKDLFSSFGADLPAPTLFVMAVSEIFVKYWWLIFGGVGGGLWFFFYTWKRSAKMQAAMDKAFLKAPVFGDIIRKATIARWTRTLSTMFAAGVPLVEALESVGGASGNYVYVVATKKIQQEVSTGTSLTVAMQNVNAFPNMVIQMVAIGEESGALDAMLGKVADFYEEEVDNAVDALSSLLEPLIMVVLGILVGGLIIAMYLPIFKLGSVV